MHIVILRGSSGSGKSTYSKQYIDQGYIHCSADNFFIVDGEYKFDASKLFFAHKRCQEKYTSALINKQNVVVDNTNSRLSELKTYLEPAKLSHYGKIEVITCVCSVETSFKRNIHHVPREVCERMFNSIMQNLVLDEPLITQHIINTAKY
jgi:predicted kinase